MNVYRYNNLDDLINDVIGSALGSISNQYVELDESQMCGLFEFLIKEQYASNGKYICVDLETLVNAHNTLFGNDEQKKQNHENALTKIDDMLTDLRHDLFWARFEILGHEPIELQERQNAQNMQIAITHINKAKKALYYAKANVSKIKE